MADDEQTLERELQQVLDEVSRANEARILEPAELRSTREDKRLDLERRLAAIRGQEYADAIELDAHVKLYGEHYLFSAGHTSVVLCESYDVPLGKTPTIALVFRHCHDNRLDLITDDAYRAHPLYGKGLGIAGMFVVINSRWKGEMKAIAATREGFNKDEWDPIRHYLLRLKDGDFSCLSAGFTTRVLDSSIVEVRHQFEHLRGSLEKK